MTPRALLLAVSLLAAGCQANLPEPRAVTRGLQAEAGVLAPYDDGKLHLAAGRYGLAIKRFGQALAHDRRSLDALNGLAIAYTHLDRFDLAQAYFERALELDPFSAATYNNYGRALLQQGRLRDARPFLRMALQHASQTEVAVIAGNVTSLRRAAPPALVTALRAPPNTATSGNRGLIRMAANRYRLETVKPPPVGVAQGRAALNAVLRPPGLASMAPHRAALMRIDARVAAAAARRLGGSALGLASIADLEARAQRPQQLTAEPQAAAASVAVLSASRSGSRAAPPAPGEPT